MALKIRSGSSTWDTATAIKVRNGSGGWTSATNGYVRGPSGWQQFFSGLPILPQFNNTTYDIELERGYYSLDAPNGQAAVDIILNSSGTGAYRFGDSDTATTNFTTFTWLPSGASASNYYAYMDAPTGDSFSAGSSATASSLVLSTSRLWTVLSQVNANPGNAQRQLTSTLRIKDSGGNDLVARTLSMYAYVDLGVLV